MTNQQAKKCPHQGELDAGNTFNHPQDLQQHANKHVEVNHSPVGRLATPAFARAVDIEPYIKAGFQLIPLNRWDAKNPKGKPTGKAPREKAWQAKDYDSVQVLEQALRTGANIGIRLTASLLVLDVDPRNYPDGRNSLDEFVADLQLDLTACPHVKTGSGGDHYYFTKPADVSVLDSIEAYQGIEFKSFGRQVVSAGSKHPNGKLYEWDDLAPFPHDPAGLPPIPDNMLALIRRPILAHGEALSEGDLTPEMLAKTLEHLDAEDFKEHDKWRDLMMACHYATGGDGRQEFIDWSTQDADYADDGWIIGRRWDSLHSSTSTGARPITTKLLHKWVQAAGGSVEVAEPEDDFEVWERPSTIGQDVDDDKLRAEPAACLEALLPPLKLNKKDQPETSYPNCLKLIRHINKDLGLVHDEFGGEVHLASPMLPWTEKVGHKLTDNVLRLIRRYMVELTKVDWSADNIFEAVSTVALENMTHPVRDYLDGLTWDGVARLDTLLVDYVGADDNPYIRAIGAKALIAAVRRVRQPGCKFDNVIILEGFQGVGKSSFVQALCPNPDWFSDAPIGNAESKDAALGLEGHWIIELGEMSVLSKSGVEALKVFVSTGTDKLRRPYGRVVEHIPRQCIFIGSTNQDTYLKDVTGNRRFWPVRTGVVDLEGLKANIGQVWAEASLRESKGESIILPPELWADAAKEQEERVAEDPWADIIRDYVDAEPSTGVTPAEPIDRVHSTTLLTQVLGIPPAKQSHADAQKLKIVMTKDLGWEYKLSLRIGTRVTKGYIRG
ncbi:hypothetical protein JCM14076_18960 [Methylosoma difficile]